MKYHNPPLVVSPFGGYAHGIEVPVNARFLCVSGQVGVDLQGRTPSTMAGQAQIIWSNIAEILKSADMTLQNIIKLNTYAVDPDQISEAVGIQRQFIGDHTPAHTLLYVQRLFRPEWLIEIEAVAARSVDS